MNAAPLVKPAVMVPVIPDSAPFTAEQRAYLNGFLAGLYSRAPVPALAGGGPSPARALLPLTVLYGSQTGTAEKLAKRIAKTAGKQGFAPTVQDLAKYPPATLASEERVLLIASTFGEGEPPDNAKAFWKFLSGEDIPRLPETRFSVCALGDQSYPQFCAFGKALDQRLEKLGGIRAYPRQDCDVDFERAFQQWLSGALGALDQTPRSGKLEAAMPEPEREDTGYSRARPYAARLVINRRLTGPESAKDVRHFEIALGDSGLTYEAGDALGVWPTNDPDLVQELLNRLGSDGAEMVMGREASTVPLRLALLSHYEITRIPRPLLEHFAHATRDVLLQRVTATDANGELQRFLYGREIIDLLAAHDRVAISPAEFIGCLRPLQPRLYSIASSPKAHPGQVHLCVSAVRYQTLSRSRKGVASTFLADRVTAEISMPIYPHPNPAFRPPTPETRLIMVGPGTGIAPFRAFLEERRAVGAAGQNWLFFGEQHAATDFLYREEIESFQRDGSLHRLDLAWSRDQGEKIYVQNRMLEQAREFFDWLESGAAVYVCGDAARMAKDVDAALRQIIQQAGGKSPEASADYLDKLQADGRYCRDVY